MSTRGTFQSVAVNTRLVGDTDTKMILLYATPAQRIHRRVQRCKSRNVGVFAATRMKGCSGEYTAYRR
jgi:hypothetical protein